jgi:hypothetical protein
MSKVRALVLLTMVMGLVSGAALANDTPFLVVAATPNQTAVFLPFVAVDAAGEISTALSVSNVLAAPDAIEAGFFANDSDTLGTLTFYIWKADGTMLTWETDSADVGNMVLDSEGKLGPGQTFTITVEEILDTLGELPEGTDVVVGYGWVIGNFDAIQGTVNVYYPGLGFAQSLNMEPTLGGVWTAGIPLPLVPML